MTASRTRRFIGGLSLGFLYTAIVTVVGLWLTPYLLRHLDQHNYGLWLLALQTLFYLGLTDVGIVALLPREIALATGRAGATMSDELRHLIGETTRLVLWQAPFVAIAAVGAWWFVSVQWPTLGGPFAVVAVTFVLTFPLRIFSAVLQGLQDLTFLGGTHLAAWIGGTLVTVALVETGFAIYALAAGWACVQIVGSVLAWWRLRSRFPEAMPRRLSSLPLDAARAHLGRGVWISVSQIAQVLLNGTDLLVVGAVLGPAATVLYACTGKLMTVLANQAQLGMQLTLPGLSELRASAPRARMFAVSTSMSQLLLISSGAIACIVLTVNGPFVAWWVGPGRFGGPGLTALLVLGMLLRHWNLAAVYTLFSCGHERRLAITTAADGVVGLLAMVLLVPWLGLKGAALGSLIGTVAVSLPGNLRALAREEGVPLGASLRPLRPWFGRFVPAFGVVLAAAAWWPAQQLLERALLGSAVALVYALLMFPLVLRPPLGAMLAPRLNPWLALIPGVSRRLASEPLP